uniref:ZAD domain-containing protein n=2 Tax=Anopheles gambiae TaxID=7165 RepID=A0A1S4GJW3_ANOGA
MAELCNSLACRLCLQKQFQLLPMFPANEPVNDDLLRKIYECASVRISYEYDQSSAICIKCIVDVEQFYTFKQRCVENDVLFQKLRQDCSERGGLDEGEFEGVPLPETEFIEPITNLDCPRPDASKALESFAGPSQLTQIGYNYRIVRVNGESDVLVYHKHRFYQPEPKAAESNKWICVAYASNNCPASITIPSPGGLPLALFTKSVRHNHSESIVQMIGTGEEPGSEEIVHSEPGYALVVDPSRRMRLLAGGYRFRLRHAMFGAGRSLWVCVRSECSASVQLSYEDSRTCIVGDESHCHEMESGLPLLTTNTDLMAQQKPNRLVRTNGLNYFIAEGALVYSGNYYKPHDSADHAGADQAAVWKCRMKDCAAKVEIQHKTIATSTGNHNHARQITKTTNAVAKQTIQQGVNYRLMVEEHGYVRLQHRKQKYALQKLLPNGTSEWACVGKVLGCKVMLRMLPDEQIVYGCTQSSTVKHEHRVGNVLEQHFLRDAAGGEKAPGTERKLWCTPAYELLWNRNSKPIVRRQDYRYYGRTAYVNGAIEWHCVRGVGTHCEATVTIGKCGEIVAEHPVHDHERTRIDHLHRMQHTSGPNPSSRDIFTSPGPVRLLAGGFNYRRMHDDHLNIDIVVHVAHKYLPDGSGTNGYHCILRDGTQACPGKIVLTNNALCAEIVATHNHLARAVPKIVEPDRTAQVIVEGPNYELIYSMTGRNCLLLHEGHVFRVYKLQEPTQTSRWRCIHSEAGCKAFLSVPLTLSKPATMDDHPHDHSRVRHDSTANLVKVKEEISDDSKRVPARRRETYECIKTEDSPRLRPRAVRETLSTEDVKGTLALINPTTSDDQSHELTLSMFQDIRGTLIKEEMKREMLQIKPDPDAMTCFLNGHLYVRQFEDLESLESPEWLCAFHWTLGCNARLSDLSIHTHERFATVRTNDRFNMLKNLISQGLVGQRGVITQMPGGQKVSEYELVPSNGNLSLMIDENRYYFYKAKNNGEWLWRCVRYRWQGCKIGVAVSHCFGKYYYQPYGKTEHVHTP